MYASIHETCQPQSLGYKAPSVWRAALDLYFFRIATGPEYSWNIFMNGPCYNEVASAS